MAEEPNEGAMPDVWEEFLQARIRAVLWLHDTVRLKDSEITKAINIDDQGFPAARYSGGPRCCRSRGCRKDAGGSSAPRVKVLSPIELKQRSGGAG